MALRAKIGPDEAEPAGCGGSTVKGENEVWPDFLRNPQVSVVRASDNFTVGTNDDWSSESATAIMRTSAAVGAFPLSAGSRDAVVILSLKAGAYVAQVNSPDATDTGQALIEVYILP